MSTKYGTDNLARLLATSDGRTAALTDHALHRWRMRTPASATVPAREAFRRGEAIRDPGIVFSEDRDELVEARVFKMARGRDEWTAIFLVVVDQDQTRVDNEHNAELVIPTVLRVRQIEHGPTRAYLNSHGPHLEVDA